MGNLPPPRLTHAIVRIGVAIWLTVLAGCQGEAARPQPNLVLIVLDTVGPTHLSAYGYPRPTTPYLERFAKRATRFDRAYSTSSWTLPAHASAFTGLAPIRHGADQISQRLSSDPVMLAELLTAAGYQPAGFSNNPWVSHKRGTARGFEFFAELFRTRHILPYAVERHATVDAVSLWLRSQRDTTRPFFVFVNLTEAHAPYSPPWIYAEPFFEAKSDWMAALNRMSALLPLNVIRRNYLGGVEGGMLQPADIEMARNLYDGEIRYLDAIVERLVGEIETLASERPTLLFIASDHGENFGQHGHMGHAFSLFDSTLRIALLAAGDGFDAGATDDRLVQISDLFPTILRAAGAPIPEGIDGRELRAPHDPERGLSALYAHPVQALATFPADQRDSDTLDGLRRELRAGIIGSHKLIRGSDGTEEIYDLLDDPDEQRPIERVDESLLGRLRALAGSPRPASAIEGGSQLEVDEETRRALETMGYLQPSKVPQPSSDPP